MTSFVFENFYQTTLSSALGPSGTTLNVASATGAPTISAGQQWAVVLQSANTPNIREVVYVIGISGNTFTVIRAQEGTTALSWSIGDDLISCNTSGIMASFPQEATNNTWTGTNAFSGAVTVGTASSGSNPVPLSQAQADFAAINGNSANTFSAASAASSSQVVNLGQAQANFAALAGLATQVFSAANGTTRNNVVTLGQFSGTLSTMLGTFIVPCSSSPTGQLIFNYGVSNAPAGLQTGITMQTPFTTAFLGAVGGMDSQALPPSTGNAGVGPTLGGSLTQILIANSSGVLVAIRWLAWGY